MKESAWLLTLLLIFNLEGKQALSGEEEGRVFKGLQLLFDFSENSISDVENRAGNGLPIHFLSPNGNQIRISQGALEVTGKSLIRSETTSTELTKLLQKNNALSVEVWIKAANATQKGPARIVTLSKNSNERNFTLGQEGNRYQFRLRTTKTRLNGMPPVSSKNGSVKPARLQHVIYTRDSHGQARLFVDGELSGQSEVAGNFSNWDPNLLLGFADEQNGGRPWNGRIHLVAIYNLALSAAEVSRNFRQGPSDDQIVQRHKKSEEEILSERNAEFFETKIAPLLAQNCIDCHDAHSSNGKLDLSSKAKAFAFPDLVSPGNSTLSLLWESIDSDEMPKDREPLQPEEKLAFKKWIDSGAEWPLAVIDPADYIYQSENRAATSIRRLTVDEYIATVLATTGVDIENEAHDLLPKDIRADGFSNTAYNLNVDFKHVEVYASLASKIVAKMNPVSFAARFSNRKELTDRHMETLLQEMGTWVLRGPLSSEELISFRGVSTDVTSTGGDFGEAISYVLESMLQSPRFLYRIETRSNDNQRSQTVQPYELASRLSYAIWGASPDKPLMLAAKEGNLFRKEEVQSQVKRMLQDPRAIQRSLQFANEWLHLDSLDHLKPSLDHYPNWDDEIAREMKQETLAFFEEVVWKRNLPLSALFNSQVTFLSEKLAKHYGISVAIPAGTVKGETALRSIDLNEFEGRGGLLTQGSFLTKGGDEASMVTRGLFVLHDVLRGVVSDPPPCVDTTPVDSQPGLTQRSIAEDRIAKKSCGGCHARFEPLAFGLEKFDGLGSWYDEDKFGNSLREDGDVLIPGEAEFRPYQSVSQLMDILAASERVSETVSWKIAQFALGRRPDAKDTKIIRNLHKEASQKGGTYSDVITALAISDLIRRK